MAGGMEITQVQLGSNTEDYRSANVYVEFGGNFIRIPMSAILSMVNENGVNSEEINAIIRRIAEVESGLNGKADASGYVADKFLGTDANGSIIVKDSPTEISSEEIASAVNDYLVQNPVQAGATTEQAQQIDTNKQDIANLKTGKLNVSGHAVNKYLATDETGNVVTKDLEATGMTAEQSQQLATNTTDISNLKQSVSQKANANHTHDSYVAKAGHTANKYIGTDATGNIIEKEAPTPVVNNYTETVENPYTLPQASATQLGGIKASPKTEAETVEVKIGSDGKLYVPPTQGGVLDINQIASQLEIQPSVDEAGDMTFSIVAKTGGTV